MRKPRKYTIKLSAYRASLDGARDPWGREWIYKAETGTASATGDSYKQALLELAHKLEFPA